jgi:acetoin utilization deacetylase AcuC-like enzyme
VESNSHARTAARRSRRVAQLPLRGVFEVRTESASLIRATLTFALSRSTLSEVSKARSGEDSDSESDSEDLRARVVEAGLTGECAAWPGLWKWCRALAGGVLASVELLQTPARQLHTCLYWLGGRHHAKKDEASGFCYINDAVLGAAIFSSRFGPY